MKTVIICDYCGYASMDGKFHEQQCNAPVESTPPKPLEPQRTHVPFTTSDVCWCQPFDGPMHPQCPMHGDKCQCKDGPCLSDDMLERGYVCASLTPPKPAHIDTTAPEVIRPELQMLEIDSSPKGPEFPFDVPDDDNGYKCEPTPSPIDTTGKEMRQLGPLNARDQSAIDAGCNCDRRMSYMDWSHANTCPLHFEPAPASIATTQGDAEPCIDCCEPGSTKETIEEQKIPYGQTGVVLTAYVPVFTCTKCGMQWTDWRGEGIREKVVAAYLAQPKPAPQAEAQESFQEWFTDERADKYQYGAEGPARDAWNAQQAKIEALERYLKLADEVTGEHERRGVKQRAKIAELEQQILLIQSNLAEERLGAERLRSRMLGVVDGFKAAKSDKEKLREGK